MARIVMEDTDGRFTACGGSIIRTDDCGGRGAILTAAHCVDGKEAVSVWIGCTLTNCQDPGRQGIFADHWVVHQNWTYPVGGVVNDIAVIFLEQSITVDGATSIDLHADISELNDNDNIQVFGYYGSCEHLAGCVGGSDTDTLEYALLTYMPTAECVQEIDWRVDRPEDLCVIDDFPEEQSTCFGDSGSPALFQDKQVGINSWGASQPGSSCDPALPQVMASVPFYKTWVEETLAAHCSLAPPAEVTSRQEIEAQMDRARAFMFPKEEVVNGESGMLDMDRVGLVLDGESGNNEAISVRNVVFLVLGISGILLIAVVMLGLGYWRYIGEDTKEEMTPLLSKKDIEF